MQSQDISDLAQHQRTHGDFPIIEKLPLSFHYRLCHAKYGVKTLLDILDEPACLLQLTGKPASALLRKNAGVQAVDAQFRVSIVIDRDCPLAAYFANDDIGGDVTRIKRRVLGAGPRVQPADQLLSEA